MTEEIPHTESSALHEWGSRLKAASLCVDSEDEVTGDSNSCREDGRDGYGCDGSYGADGDGR